MSYYICLFLNNQTHYDVINIEKYKQNGINRIMLTISCDS